jgi:hypothetical protein
MKIITMNNVAYTYSNDAKFHGSIPAPIDMNATCRIIGENLNGLKPYGNMVALVTVTSGNYSIFGNKRGMA